MSDLDEPHVCVVCGFQGTGREAVIHVQQVHPDLWELTELLDQEAGS